MRSTGIATTAVTLNSPPRSRRKPQQAQQSSTLPVTPPHLLIGLAAALADPAQALPKPLYLRGPDARPQHGARIARR